MVFGTAVTGVVAGAASGLLRGGVITYDSTSPAKTARLLNSECYGDHRSHADSAMMTRILFGRSLLAGATATVAGLAWYGAARPVTPIGAVIITLDTTRADRLSPYGFMNVSLPHLERLAREGVVFDQATTVAPLTLTAHTSLFTGLVPPHHGVRDNADTAAGRFGHRRWRRCCRARGFRTGAFVGSVVLGPIAGLQAGLRASITASAAHDDRIGGTAAAAGERGDRRRASSGSARSATRPSCCGRISTTRTVRTIRRSHIDRLYGHDQYVGEIAFADSQVGRLLQALEQRRLLDRTVVVVVADHGESLGGHGEQDHGIFVYEDVVHVPLIVRAPAVAAWRVGDVVRLTDVMPTVLDLLGVPSPAVDGVSLVDLMRGRRTELNLEAYSESLYPERLGWSPLLALRSGRFKFIEAPRPRALRPRARSIRRAEHL